MAPSTPATPAEPRPDRAGDGRARRARRYQLLLPLLWGLGNLLGFEYRGDEYGFWYVTSLPGIWGMALVGDDSRELTRVAVLLCGGATTFGAGWLLDRGRLALRVWVPLAAGVAALATLSLLRGFEDLEQARQKNGPLLGYVNVGTMVGLYVATTLGLVGLGVLRGARALARRVALARSIGD